MKKVKEILLIAFAGLIFLILTEPVRSEEIKDVAKDLVKYYGKSVIEQHVDFDNSYIKYGGGIISTISEKEIKIDLGNTNIKIDKNNIGITFKKIF